MKSLFAFLIFSLFSTPLFAWPSESGSGVVSDQEVIVRASLEATQVLKSDVLTQLLGETQIGGVTNYTSLNSGGVLSFRNSTSSADQVLFSNNRYLSWVRATAGQPEVRVGLSSDDTFVIPQNTRIVGAASFNSAAVSGAFRVSGDANFVRVSSNNVRVLSGGILSSSSDTSLINVSATNVHVTADLRVSDEVAITGVLNIRKTTVAGLPASSANTSGVQLVTDANSTSDCTTGSGGNLNLCISSGGPVWVDA